MASSSLSHKRSRSELQRETFTVSKQLLYDAFINHRGPDTKDTLAFALYDSLEEKGFWTFLDDQKLRLGDSFERVLQDAIYSSSVQIAIFSKLYVESPWCLNELLDMLKTNALFIPIFCDVKPSDLRYPEKGVYKDSFTKHAKKGRFSEEKLQEWKEALRSSAAFSGHEFNTSKDNVEELCAKISLAVERRVGKKGFLRDAGTANDAEVAESTSISGQWKKSSLLPRDSHPVGIHSKVEEIQGLLKNPDHQVIAVVGMGGLGKTFLLQNVFKALKSRFDGSVWLSISKSYSVKNLQHNISSHIGLTKEIVGDAVTEERAAELIHERLEGKRCLIVLDDLWTLSTEDDLLDKLGLPTHKDCKVVVTTRNRKVAQNSKSYIYEMEKLSDEDSWELFCFYAFLDCKENRAPLHLEEVGRKIVKQCGNLPLAIKTTAASLANNTRLSKWESKHDELKRAAIPFGERDTVMDILRLSYDSLPAHLKTCFAYLSFFPEDEKIECEYLVYLWIAEGFIPAEAGERQWNMAWDWLDRLAQLCLLHLWEEEEGPLLNCRLIKYCRVHDLLHDLAINISRENKCAFSVEEAYTHANGGIGWCRILLAKRDIKDNALSLSPPAYLRTLSLSQNWDITNIPESLFNGMRGLRVLDLSNTWIFTLPESVGKMVLLKVLNLRNTRIEKLPECVRYLKSLLFLALPDYCKELPEWITGLTCLQHLECYRVDRMPNLVSLRMLRTQTWIAHESIEEDLPNMTQLQEVRLRVNSERELKRIEEGLLAHLLKMRCLGICNDIREYANFGQEGGEMTYSGYKLEQLPEKIREMKHLEKFDLSSFVMPRWICDLSNLKELALHNCHCVDYPELQSMPNLVRLALWENEWCIELPKEFGKSGAFPSLRFFTIDSFEKMEEFPDLEEGAMPCLESLCILGCVKLKKVGGGLERLKRLKVLTYSDYLATNELIETFKEGGEYCNKIKAINPHVTINIKWV